MSEDRADVLLEKWKKILGLTDWKINLHTGCSLCETQNCTGLTEWDEVNKAAVVKMIDAEEYGERMLPYCFEETLIHELLHVKFTLLQGNGDFQDRYVHQIIEEFARILSDLGGEKNETADI